MAIYHLSMKPVARSSGRSAVASAAYRAAERLTNARDGLTHDFSNRQGVEHAEIVLPEGVIAEWARSRSALWNAAERAEKRSDARVAREFEVALPHELSADQRLALTRAFARHLADRYGAALDIAIHRPHVESDVRNHHAHILMTTRQVTETGLGDKTLIERENRWLLANTMATAQMQLRELRQAFEEIVNRQLAIAGLDIRVDHRSHQERGLEIEPGEHVGVHATQLERHGATVSRTRIDAAAARRNGELIRNKPEQILTVVSGEKSVFDRHDIARALHRSINEPQAFQNAFAAVMASPVLVELKPETATQLARYSTREMIAIEQAIAGGAERMSGSSRHAVQHRHVERALRRQDDAIRAGLAASLTARVERDELQPAELQAVELQAVDRDNRIARAGLSAEQRVAVGHITGPAQISAVIGFAGAGKSTMLAAARQAWEAQGYRVHGAALAGKAAEGLEESSGIPSSTLASWEHRWQAGRGALGGNDVLVIDEAGMVGSRQLARFVNEAEARGAKLVLVGDHEQLQAIGAGAPFRAIAERVGAVALSEIRRQTEGWQREASIAFATHRTGDGLSLYAGHDAVQFCENRDEARSALVRDYLADLEGSSGSRIALAHRRADVASINADIRAGLQARGLLARGEEGHMSLGRELVYQTNDGQRCFAPGDRIVLLENSRELKVKNGMLGTVEAVELGALQIRLDGRGQATPKAKAQVISIPVKSYQAFDHGYATTIHKAQGATVDRAFVLASATMDRHLTYVAMTRHREGVQLYAGRDEFRDMTALSAGMGRSGAKETTLDYVGDFAARRGLAEAFGIRSEIGLGPTRDGTTHSERVEPLVPALTSYSQSIEAVARERARPEFERAMEAVRSVGRHVYTDPDRVAARLSAAIVDKAIETQQLATSVAERPEQFGELRGASSLLGENKERKAARHYAKALGHHVASAGLVWARRFEAARQSEAWNREKRDVVAVPGLSPGNEAILRELDRLPRAEQPKFLEQLSATPEGKQALAEAKTIAQALERRFGSADPRAFNKELDRLEAEDAAKIARIKDITRIVDRAQRAELSRQYELKRSLNKGLGLGM